MNTTLVFIHALDTRAILLGQAEVDAPVLRLPMGAARAVLGFPSPAEDFEGDSVDLNELLVRNPPATFLYRAEGCSMIGAGICDGDVLIVDRSV
ncbi:MAG: S24 family peptidase, partial [Candidatus Macondimonas sp.]